MYYIALLRAVNVGGTGTLPMADLRALCEESCFTRVETHPPAREKLFASLRSAVSRLCRANNHPPRHALFDRQRKQIFVPLRVPMGRIAKSPRLVPRSDGGRG